MGESRNLSSSEEGNSSTKFYKWNESATSKFDDEETLSWIRDAHPDDVSDTVFIGGIDLGIVIIEELLGHGHLQKAALVSRRLIKVTPELEILIKGTFGKEIGENLFDTPLLKLPKSPKDYNLDTEYPDDPFPDF